MESTDAKRPALPSPSNDHPMAKKIRCDESSSQMNAPGIMVTCVTQKERDAANGLLNLLEQVARVTSFLSP